MLRHQAVLFRQSDGGGIFNFKPLIERTDPQQVRGPVRDTCDSCDGRLVFTELITSSTTDASVSVALGLVVSVFVLAFMALTP